MTTPRVTIVEATGNVPIASPPIDDVCAFIGPCTVAPGGAPALYGRSEALYTAKGVGPGVRAAGAVIKGTRKPMVFRGTTISTNGTHGTVDSTGKLGTSVVTMNGATTPYDDAEVWLYVVTGGTIGVAGIVVKTSTDGGRHYAAPVALGTAAFYLTPIINSRFNFAAGTLLAGDVVKVVASAPAESDAEVTAAFASLASSSLDFSMVYVAGTVLAARAAVIIAGLNTLLGVGKRCVAMFASRPQGASEIETDWISDINTTFASVLDDRLARVDGTAWVTIEEGPGPSQVQQFKTTWASSLMTRICLIDRFLSPAQPADGPLPGVSLVDTGGALIGHDENYVGGFDEGRGMALYRIPDPSHRGGAYLSHPYMLKPPTSRISQWQVRRVVNAMERVANGLGIDSIATPLNYDPDTGLISVQSAEAIAALLRGPLSTEFANDISNPNAEDLVQVDRAVTVSGDDAFISATVALSPFKYVGGLTITFNIKI